VRGPASPIYGPSKVGGYLNFIPKSARADTGAYLPEAKGEIGVTYGSWNEKTLHAELGGPSDLFGLKSGFYVFAKLEDSGSYYENSATREALYQASYNVDFSDSFRTEAGGMYQGFEGNQVAGWNRLTQALINNGTYITGNPTNIDTNGNGLIDQPEYLAAKTTTTNGVFIFNPPGDTPAQIQAALAGNPNLALVDPGTTHLKGSQVLTAPGDRLDTGVTTLYFDAIFEPSESFKATNKLFFEDMNNINENAYGFSQYAQTWALEDQLDVSGTLKFGNWLTASVQTGPQFRHQDFHTGDDFAGEMFDRRDLSAGTTVSNLDTDALATRGQALWSDHSHGYWNDAGYALLTDLVFFEHLDLLLGGRFDNFHVLTASYDDTLANPGAHGSSNENHTSWSASISYGLPFGLRPYVTAARQSTLTTGEGGQIDPSQVDAGGHAVAASTLKEYGLKGSWLDNKLYWALDWYDQQRTDFDAQDFVSDASTRTKGLEFETRWVVSQMLTVTGAYTNIKVYNTTAQGSAQFSFVGAGDLQGVNPALMYGGSVGAVFVVDNNPESRKGGIPENIESINGFLNLDDFLGGIMQGALKGMTMSVGVTHVDSTFSGFSKTITLPSYTLLNAGIHYENTKWKVSFEGKNLSDARYFRSNFPDLFGESVVLPELPINWHLGLGYKF
jgi:iron complex outermembrane recepter protein